MNKRLEDYTREELIDTIKSLKSRKKFGLVWEDKPEQVAEDCKKKLPVLTEVEDRAVELAPDERTNLIIEGDNYHALSVLNYTHTEQFDLIYIDPPYNTTDTKWIYNNNYVDKNDSYRHSKWLSFMEKRLRLAKNLLKKDGALICAIDKNEQAQLQVMMEEVFTEHEIHTITIVHNPRGVQGKNFSYTNEFAIFAIPRGAKTIGPRQIDSSEVDWRNLRDNGGQSLRTDARNCFYPINITPGGDVIGFGEVVLDSNIHPLANVKNKDGTISVYPIDKNRIERKWRYARQTVDTIRKYLRSKKGKDGVYQIELGKDYGTYRTVWEGARYDANEFGTKLINSIVPHNSFDFPKSLWNTYDCIYAVVGNKKDAAILDFFAGSGTTGQAVLELNKKDGGHRQFILCTNNENKIAEEVTYPRVKTVITGKREDGSVYSDGIPANLRYFKTSFVDKNDTLDKLRRELSPACEDMIRIREGAFEKIIDEDMFKVFKNRRGLTAVIYDRFDLDNYIEKIEALETDAPVHLYVFSYDKGERSDQIPKTAKHTYESQPIPEGVLEVYKRIFR